MLCLATLMIPLEVTFITNLDTITSLHWFNTYAGLSVPFLATGFGIFLLRQAFLQIPRDLQEAAQLDGYGHLRFMTRVAVPLARPSLAALAVFSFLGAWNQYLWPLVSTGGTTPLNTVQIGLKQLLGTQVSQIPVSLAGAVIAFVPAGDPAPGLPEAARAQPHGGRRQVAEAASATRTWRAGARKWDMRTPRLSRLAAAALFVTTLSGTAGVRRHRRQCPGRRGQPAHLQPQGAGQPQGPRQHHLLGVGLGRPT